MSVRLRSFEAQLIVAEIQCSLSSSKGVTVRDFEWQPIHLVSSTPLDNAFDYDNVRLLSDSIAQSLYSLGLGSYIMK